MFLVINHQKVKWLTLLHVHLVLTDNFFVLFYSTIPDNYKVLFLQGGGTGQFAAIPLNLAKGLQSIQYFFFIDKFKANHISSVLQGIFVLKCLLLWAT